MVIFLSELEQAINYWRNRSPSTGEERRLSAQAAALAEPYALMIVEHRTEIDDALLGPAARDAFDAWRAGN